MPRAAGAADGVELVDEHDGRRGLLGLLEEVAHPRGADTDDHLDELRRRQGEEGHPGLAGHGPGQQRLARPGRTRQQHTARDGGAEAAVPIGVAQEVDDLDQFVLGLVDAGDVGEGGPLGLVVDPLGPRPAHPHESAGGAAAEHRHEQTDEQHGGTEAEQQVLPERNRCGPAAGR